MKLISVRFSNFRRFRDESLDFDGRLIALVGPNEAGKSSVLAGLQQLESVTAFPATDIARGQKTKPSDIAILARYLLEESETRRARELGLRGEPRWYVLWKKWDGGRQHHVEPDVQRDLTYRGVIAANLASTAQREPVTRGLESLPVPPEEKDETHEPAGKILNRLLENLGAEADASAKQLLRDAKRLLSTIGAIHWSEDVDDAAKQLCTQLELLIAEEARSDPRDAYLKELDSNRPEFLYFDERQRDLQGEYPNSVLPNPPPALSNLFALAEISPGELASVLGEGNHGARNMLAERANAVLRKRFEGAWHQASVYVHLSFDVDVVRILVRAANTYCPIAERSEGLRAFVALYSFAAPISEGAPIILLIDEAETHLHYDAQADLIRVLSSQEVASQVIYTTHSAGCLPHDLGAGIRVVRQLAAEDGSDTGASELRNSVWIDSPGFSPLLLAMGASVMALSPARRAVLTEGHSDAVVLPSLLREVCGLEDLGFQVVPGLASVPEERAAELDLEAPRLCFLLDGDDAGREHAAKLRRAGIAPEAILHLEEGLVIEDYLAEGVLLSAINEELRRSHGEGHKLESADLPRIGRASAIDAWCANRGVSPPKRVKVAAHVVALRRQQRLSEEDRRESLSRLFLEITTRLKLAQPTGAKR